MTRELVPVGDALHLADPSTGETIALADAPNDLIGEVIASIDERIGALRDARRELGDEFIRRMDRAGEWTILASGRKYSAPSPAPQAEWDVELLAGVLASLVEAGVIDRDASLRALEPRTEWRPLVRGLNALEKIPGVAEKLALCKRSVPRENRSVRRG